MFPSAQTRRIIKCFNTSLHLQIHSSHPTLLLSQYELEGQSSWKLAASFSQPASLILSFLSSSQAKAQANPQGLPPLLCTQPSTGGTYCFPLQSLQAVRWQKEQKPQLKTQIMGETCQRRQEGKTKQTCKRRALRAQKRL